MANDIDFVVTWVDGNDPEWQNTRAKFLGNITSGDNSGENRYRDWDLMRYWFRGVEKFAPWVRKVYFVTCGQKPEWLNAECSKLVLVDHKDYMPEESLPTFNSNAIEVGIHKIKDLSNNFVLFNDDFFPVAPMTPEDFFVNGVPCDYAALDCLTPSNDFEYIRLNNVLAINRHFNKQQVISANRSKWYSLKDPKSLLRTLKLSKPWTTFPGIRDYHVPTAFTKSDFEKVWEAEPAVVKETQNKRFRSKEDISIWLMRYWHLMEGNFTVKSQQCFGYTQIIDDDVTKICEVIESGKKKVLVINDEYKGNDFEKTRDQLIRSFEKILPGKSSFEI